MFRLIHGITKLVCALFVLALPAIAQQNLPDSPTPKPQSQSATQQQSVPDAPQPKNPQNQFPDNAPAAPKNVHPDEPAATPTPTPQAQKARPGQTNIVTDVGQFGTMSISVNFVQIPVTVKDSAGKLVPGLGSDDFRVYEDGVPQQLRFFTSDSFPLSAAVIIDTNLPSSTMKKVNESLPALMGAFSEYDEVALYRYGSTVQQISGFTGATSVSTATLNRIKRPGRESGPPVAGGPFGGGPTINGHPVNDPNANGGRAGDVQTIPQEAFVLNDAILRAAQDLSRREKGRRRIIFVISDGREVQSTARYDEVKKVLLSQDIGVFGVGVDTAAIPIYDKLNRIRVPGFGTGNILPKYAADTGGNMMAEFDRSGIEAAFATIAETARTQYTLGYNTKATQSSAYRSIDVRVLRPNLTVIARSGYYPLPPKPKP
ncbi:MAG TPA: VWA domain-containing protein [Candidatus Angelobacter sp.]|nr:VWA domain-containing protein [Candidatus Angelobacter sp.]